VLARALQQLTPVPQEARDLQPGRTELVLARDLQLTPRSQEYLASASQGSQAYSQAPGVPSWC
jgi:hypothetical protein